jgi:hypothetical protein
VKLADEIKGIDPEEKSYYKLGDRILLYPIKHCCKRPAK